MKKQLIIFSLLSFIQFVSSQHKELQLHFRKGVCLKSDNVASNSTYSKNIVFLFSNLTSLSSTSKFSTFSAGSGRDQVNGLYLCRPDLSPESCHKCISTSANDLLVNCANKKEAIQWYDECMFRYTNRSIFSTEEIEPWTSAFDTFFNVSQPQVFPTLLNRTMQGLIAEAVSPKNNLRFATGHANFTVFEGLYGMVLCTHDITGKECEDCLRTALEGLGNYTANSTYQNNLKTLLEYAAGHASHSLFGNRSVDTGMENVNMIYNCRSDLNLQECHQCIQLSALRIVTQCPVQKEAIFWHQECMLRYSPRTIFSFEDDESFSVWHLSQANVSDPLQYSEVVATTIDGLIEEAAYNQSKRGYAIGEGNVTGLVQGGKVYCYVQCTPDILGSRCERCLRAAFRSMAGCCGTNKQSVQFHYPSCQTGYSAQPFVLGSDPLQVSPPVQPGSSVPPPPPPPRIGN
ncbi:hypothetical protein Cgig2_028337 [Carnegiea gigantea]|uniref:Gnk2-homologous domain-containing protein n=1 Tax=Carnegiea gigantea TaxID=171969 RepID=A0A9Q1QJH2_9CARY|nr:hypothetical protein Cgig2_028337 [Carnegiea gigantea]